MIPNFIFLLIVFSFMWQMVLSSQESMKKHEKLANWSLTNCVTTHLSKQVQSFSHRSYTHLSTGRKSHFFILQLFHKTEPATNPDQPANNQTSSRYVQHQETTDWPTHSWPEKLQSCSIAKRMITLIYLCWQTANHAFLIKKAWFADCSKLMVQIHLLNTLC